MQKLQLLLTTEVIGALQNWQVIETGLVPNWVLTTLTTCSGTWLFTGCEFWYILWIFWAGEGGYWVG